MEEVERWMLFSDTSGGGMGATPFGTLFGSGISSAWGLFTETLTTTRLVVSCESCSRVRSSKLLGSIAVFGSYVQNAALYIVASDINPPATCFAIRYEGPGGIFEFPLVLLVGETPPALVSEPPEDTETTPPSGAPTVNRLLRAPLPEVDSTGEYSVILVDRCNGTTSILATITLEGTAMTITPLDADLGGAPRVWLYGFGGRRSSSQPAMGSRTTIPFDRCVVVLEYDARFGTGPADQGWTHQGDGSAADFVVIDGGAMLAVTTPSLESYWEQIIAVDDDPGEAFIYAQTDVAFATHVDPGDGMDFEGIYATAVSGPYRGPRLTRDTTTWYATSLDGASEFAISSGEAVGWSTAAAADNEDSSTEQVWHQRGADMLTPIFGDTGTVATMEVIGRFGDRGGRGMFALMRNFVASYGGRFIRAGFTGFAQTTTPVLRIYMSADANSSPTKTARFRVRYGPGTGDPYAHPPLTAENTTNFTDVNSVYEIPFSLTGLTANSPFWFTLERVWDHGDDQLESTVHFLQATVRSS